MDLGRVKLAVPSVAPQVTLDNLYTLLNDIYVALHTLRTDAATNFGVCMLYTSEPVSKGQAIQLSGGRVRKADRASNKCANGLAISDAGAGEAIRVIIGAGNTSVMTGLTPGVYYYLDNNGAITEIKPGSGLIQAIGFALSSTEMLVHVGTP